MLPAALGGWSAGAGAQEPQRVIVLEPTAPTALEHELLTRLVGELGAAGIEVLRVPLPAGSDPEAAVATRGRELSAVAAFATREDAGEPGSHVKRLRLWLADRVTGTVLAEHGQDDDASALASSLAVQGFELLQAREAEWGWRRSTPPPSPTPTSPPPALPPPAIKAELTAAMHLGLLLDAPTGGSALTPMARVGYEPAITRGLGVLDLGVRLSVAGLGAPTLVEATERRVEVVQSFALLEGVVALDEGWLRPFASGGVGAYRVDVNGIGSGELVGRSEQTLSPIGAAGVGLEVQPWQHWIGQLEAQGLFALHPTAVDAGDTRAATFGRVLLVFSLGFGVSW
jgi:hypothetical protein